MMQTKLTFAVLVFLGLVIAGCTTQTTQPDSAGTANPDTPVALVRITPEYPSGAQGMEGYVTLSFRLNEYGNPVDIRVIESEPGDVFDEAAVQAMRYWIFRSDAELARTGKRFRQTFEFDF